MRLVNSVCTNLVFPDSRRSLDEFRRMAGFLAERGTRCVEFFHDGEGRGRVGRVLAEHGLDAVYIAVIPSKERKLYLCDLDAGNRRRAVAMFKDCLDEAADNGIGQVMINSGRLGDDVAGGLEALAESVGALFEHGDRRDYPLRLLLEPCDSRMEAFHLIGPFARAVAFAKRMRDRGFAFELTMDSAHTVEEGEDFLAAVAAARPFCRHVHFANCRIADPADPLYGDKHLGFEYDGAVWDPAALAGLYAGLERLYPGDDELRISLEVLCREEDPYAYFERMWSSLPFLHRGGVKN